MTTLKFTDTHNMVALNPQKSTVKVKTVNEEVQLQALVDGKKIIIIVSIVRRDLQLEDVEGVDCLPNATIFEQLTLMGSKTTAWNEFSRNFLMYPRIVQVFLDKQLEGMSNHNRIYVTPSHTKKIFGNIRRVGKGFSGRETPLFQTMVVQAQEEIGEGSVNPTDPHHTPTIIQPSTSQPQKKQRPRKPKRKDTKIPQSSGPINSVADEAVNEEMDDILERAATTATSLDAELDRGGGPRRQETMGDTIAQTRFENVSKTSNDPLLVRGGIFDIDADEYITLVNDQDDADMFDVNDLDGDEVIVENVDVVKAAEETINVAATTTATITGVEVTLAQALAELKSAKPKAVKVVIQEPEQGTTTTTPTTIIYVLKPPQDKGKGIMIEEPVVEQVKPIKKLEQMRLDEKLAFKLQVEEEEEKERLARERAQQTKEANIAWDDVQAKIKVDYQLAQRLQAQEQKEFTDEENGRLFVQFLEQRRKHFAAKRAEEKKNRPPIRAQQRSIMCTYLKNIEGRKPKNLKNKSFANIQELFDKAIKRVNTFVDYRTELVEDSSKKSKAKIAQESSSKRAGDGLEQENAKKQKVDEDKETAELQSLIEVVPDDKEVAIDVVPLATKPPT
ncbi:hypothetical protein Tco_0957861, partial [Tanacetum coccineum]